VKVGDTVKRGETIALMGSTGHSTGPHVHFEVLRNGRQVDPLSFIGK
jgi:murein DD-endopeptidase MepM/ murein hydrolase activator NlpD